MSRVVLSKNLAQSYTPDTLYKTMHISHLGYRHRNQGIAMSCDWLHLLRDGRGVVHNPWSGTKIKIAEVGCGNGKLCELLVSLGLDVTGIDIFDNEVVYNRAAYKFIKHDLMKIPYPFKDNEFDYVLSFDVLEHLPVASIASTLQEIARISRCIIIGVSCTGKPPLHLTVKSPGWWLDQFTVNCRDFSWQLLRNFERILPKESDGGGRCLKNISDVRPFKNGEKITYAPLFYGKRGQIE